MGQSLDFDSDKHCQRRLTSIGPDPRAREVTADPQSAGGFAGPSIASLCGYRASLQRKTIAECRTLLFYGFHDLARMAGQNQSLACVMFI